MYDVPREAGTLEEKARKTAPMWAYYDGGCNKTEADLLVIKWMVGAVMTGTLSLEVGGAVVDASPCPPVLSQALNAGGEGLPSR
jgi:hypothetical protein